METEDGALKKQRPDWRVTGEAAGTLALALPVRPEPLLSDRDGPGSPRCIDPHARSFAAVMTDDSCLGPRIASLFVRALPRSQLCLFGSVGAT